VGVCRMKAVHKGSALECDRLACGLRDRPTYAESRKNWHNIVFLSLCCSHLAFWQECLLNEYIMLHYPSSRQKTAKC